MKNKKKYIMVCLSIFGLLTLLFGISYASYVFSGLSNNNNLKVGKLYLDGSALLSGINITNAFPLTDEEGKVQSEYFDFQIQGYTNLNETIMYSIYADIGDSEANKKRLNDDLVSLYLTDTSNNSLSGVKIANNLSTTGTLLYEDEISNGSSSIPKTKQYRLRIWVNDNVVISDSNPTHFEGKTIISTYDYANSYISVKIRIESYLSNIEGRVIALNSNANKLTLESSVGTDLYNYKIFGNSVQDTTTLGDPTPDNPVPVYSLGERTRNLFNAKTNRKVKQLSGFSNTTIRSFDGKSIYVGLAASNYYVPTNVEYNINSDSEVSVLAKSTGYGLSFDFAVTPGQILMLTKKNDANAVTFISFYTLDGTYVSNTQNELITVPDNCYWMIVCLCPYTLNQYLNYWDIQLEEGSTATNYTPYNAVEVVSTGKNLFDKSKFASISNFNKGVSTIYGYDYIDGLKPNTNYYVSITRLNGSTVYSVPTYILISGSTFSASAGMYTTVSHRTDVNDNSSPYTTDNTGRLTIGITISGKNVTTQNQLDQVWANTDIQIEEGSTSTPYEPYQTTTTTIDLTGHEPLRKIGNVADYIDYENGRIVRNIHKQEFKGTEYITEYASDGSGIYGNYSWNHLSDYPLAKVSHVLYCTHLPVVANLGTGGVLGIDLSIVNNKFYFRFGVPHTNIKTWLANQYAAGTPVTVYYQLAEPVYESITLPDIPVFEGTTYIEVSDNSIGASKIETEYYTDYQSLDYIETSGTQYIDTNFIPNRDTKVEIKIGTDEVVTGSSALFGARTSTSLNVFAVFASTASETFPNQTRFDYFGSRVSQIYNSALSAGENVIIKDETHNYINDVQETGNFGGVDFNCEYNLYIGTINTANTPHPDGFSGRIYYAKIWDAGTLIREYVPVKMNNGTIAMYDLVNDKYYHNNGTGVFTGK